MIVVMVALTEIIIISTIVIVIPPAVAVGRRVGDEEALSEPVASDPLRVFCVAQD